MNKGCFFIETYGCQMNVSDSELVTSILRESGFELTGSIDKADIIIFNTCSVREHAETRVIGRISNEVSRKMLNPDLIVGIIGCMAQRMGKRLIDINDKIDFVVGVDNYRSLPDIINRIISSSQPFIRRNKRDSFTPTDMSHIELYNEVPPIRKADLNAFVTIMRGCDNFCSYCIVPYVRGRERSRPAESILREIEAAGNDGYKDVTLLGQNVNSYKCDDVDFPDLLTMIDKIDSIKRIRFVTSHPKDISDKLIDVLADTGKVCNHIHLPIQSGDNTILKLMNRGYTVEHYLDIVNKLRRKVPHIAITSDIMVGFHGETDEQFLNTVNVMKEIEYDFAYMFKYSIREGTEAAKFADDIDESIKLARLDTIINLQNTITHKKYRQQIGNTIEVYVEKMSKKSQYEAAGKSRDFKIVVFPGDSSLIGRFVNVRITDAAGWTLEGEMI